MWCCRRALRGFFGGVFQGANYGGADGEYGALFALRLCDCLRGGFGDFVGFDVDLVVFEALGADGFEGAQANVECDFGDFDISRADALRGFRA